MLRVPHIRKQPLNGDEGATSCLPIPGRIGPCGHRRAVPVPDIFNKSPLPSEHLSLSSYPLVAIVLRIYRSIVVWVKRRTAERVWGQPAGYQESLGKLGTWPPAPKLWGSPAHEQPAPEPRMLVQFPDVAAGLSRHRPSK